MQSDVHLRYINSVHVKVLAEPSIMMELSEHFTYFADNYKFHPRYKARIWDGKLRLLNGLTGQIYSGLAQRIKKFCDARGYTFSFDDELVYQNISEDELRTHIKSLDIPAKYEERDYQFESILKCLRTGKRTLLSPTSSGKSMMIYIISQWYRKKKGLIIVPTIGLVTQMESDFRDYGYTGNIHTSIGGLLKSNDIDADIVITTWQSLNNGKSKMPKPWYQQFGYVFGDECFVKDSLVLTPSGYVKIQNLNVGDKVVNYSQSEKKFKEDIVVKVHKNISIGENVYELKFDNNKIIKCTGNHKFLTNRGWVRADELLETDEIINT